MNKHFCGFGICTRCGDMQGPWGWYEGIGLLCEDCEAKNEVISKSKAQDDNGES